MALPKYLLFCLFAIIISCEAAPAEDEITDLPGLPYPPPFKQYSGYLDANGGRHLHYWFTEAETVDPATAPVVFWFNGGPGCSSVFGMLTENGPFRVNDDGQTLIYNPYSWNKIANMIFLESPAGVGYSYSDDGNYFTDDDQTAQDNYAAVQNFFVKFPEYLPNPLFLTGESYAGMYVPMLAYLIVNGTNSLNFQAFAVGNGYHDERFNYNSEILFNSYHALNSEAVATSMFTYCCPAVTPNNCNFYDPPNVECSNAVFEAELQEALSGINVYGVYNPCERSVRSGDRYRLKQRRHYPKTWTKEQVDTIKNLRSDPPCTNSWPERTWIDQPEVRAALHISDLANWQWDSCSDFLIYRETYESMSTQYQYLLQHTRAFLYHGDTDTMCNYIGGEWFADSLGREVLKPYRPWQYNNQTAGFVKDYSNLTYTTILGAGHMVPTDRPGQALQMFSNFLNNVPLA